MRVTSFHLLRLLLCACCSFGVSVGKVAIATFYNGGVEGSVRFTQDSPSDAVIIDVKLSGLASLAGGYHVHQLPVNFGGSGLVANSINQGCGASITSAHFNPLLVPGGAGNSDLDYECSSANPEKCEAGDIAGKFGSLEGLEEIDESFEDDSSGLTLFGEHSILGRSVVVHKALDGARWLCATILEENASYKKVVTTFDSVGYGVRGTITFAQNAEEPSSETIIFVNLELGEEFSQEEAELKWEITAHQLFLRQASSLEKKCGAQSTGEAVLDLGLSFQNLKLRKSERFKSVFTAGFEQIPLSGPSSVAGNALVVRSEDSSFVDCAELGKVAAVSFEPSDSSAIEGRISFSQPSLTDSVVVEISLEGLDAISNGFHVHTLPVLSTCTSTTGHFNPLAVAGGNGAPGVYKCSTEDHAACEAGDLSGRIGGLFGRTEAKYSFVDSGAGLTLFGANSIVGRSVVIHHADGTRIACADVVESGKLTGHNVNFLDRKNALVGSLSLTQREVDPDSETTILVDLQSGEETSGHLFHVHEAPVEGTDCASTLGHFNPQGLIGGAGFTDGEYKCSQAVDFCEVGDLSGKLGTLGFPSTFVATDSKLPLTGISSIADRSITVHAEDGGGARIDCGSLTIVSFPDPELGSDEGGEENPSADTNTDSSSNNASTGLAIFFGFLTVGLILYVLELRTQVVTKAEEVRTKFEP